MTSAIIALIIASSALAPTLGAPGSGDLSRAIRTEVSVPTQSRGDASVKSIAVGVRATWYCLPGRSVCTRGYSSTSCYAPLFRYCYAAAGAALRHGDWRGRRVTVCLSGTSHCVRVRLVDYCACSGIDLYASAFQYVRPLWAGVARVNVYWVG